MDQANKDSQKRKPRKTATGVVTSAKTSQTIQVEVPYRVRHPKYEKYLRRKMKLHAHDPKGEAQEGDRVQVMECRPVSKTKTWRLVKVVEKAAVMIN